jgi:hypothetical protein
MIRRLPILLCMLIVAGSAAAQPNDANKPAVKEVAAKGKTDPEAERLIRERRAQAQSLLISLASDAGSYNDLKLRARTLGRVADVLWDADPDRARTLFRKAWDAAEIVDQDNLRKMQEDIKQQQAKNGNSAVQGPPNIRGEVLRLAARRDRALGEEFLGKLNVEKAREAADATERAKNDPFNTPEGITQRLSLARQLLSTDVVRALQFADPALASLTREGIDFLSYLRDKDAAPADQRYAMMLAMASNDLQSDANSVSMLSSYLFTPHVFVIFTGSGGASTMSTSRGGGPVEVTPQLRAAFFRTAAGILLRPLPPPGQDQSTSGLQGRYLMIKRLLPLFEQFAPREMTDAMRAQMDALATAVPEDLRQRDDDSIREGIRPPQSTDDREKALLDRIDHAKTSDERDNLYLQLARIYADKGDLRAHDFVDKIEDSEMRKNTRSYIDVTLVMRFVEKKDIDGLLEMVRSGELTHMQKSWALASAARWVEKTDHDKALSLLEDAGAEARRIEGSDPDRARALMAVANALQLLDHGKAWDATYDAVKAANSAEGFTGEDGAIRIGLQTKTGTSLRASSVQEFDVAGLFTELAKEDYNRTVELARGFDREAPRASAVIAIARSVLENKEKTTPRN